METWAPITQTRTRFGTTHRQVLYSGITTSPAPPRPHSDLTPDQLAARVKDIQTEVEAARGLSRIGIELLLTGLSREAMTHTLIDAPERSTEAATGLLFST